MKNTKLLIILFLSFSFTIVFCFYDLYQIEAQEFYKNHISSSNSFVDVNNSEINIQIKYPENWTFHYIKGNNNSKVASNESFKGFSEEFKEQGYYKNLDDFEKYQLFLRYINTDCGFLTDCRLIGDGYLRNYMLDNTNFLQFISIFDYLPSLRFLSPAENSTDNFLENVKIASFKLPHNYTLADFMDYYLNYHRTIPSIDIKDNCQSYVLGYPGCEVNYIFTVGNNMEYREYESLELLIEKNSRIYIISYNSLSETYLKYIELVQNMLESIKLP